MSKARITADDAETSTLTVFQDGIKQTNGYQIKMKAPGPSAFVNYDQTTFKTSNAGTYVFVVEKGALSSAQVSIEAVAKPITLSLVADRQELKANGRDKLTLKVNSSDKSAKKSAVIYYTSPTHKEPVRLTGREFSTREAGRYIFHATFGTSVKSQPVEVTFVRSILSIKAKTTTIKANGKEGVDFTVWQDEERVTSGYEILMSKEREGNYRAIEHKPFTTTTAGTFYFIAKYDGFRSEPMSIVAQNVKLTLTTDSDDLIANGSDRATFTLREDGRTVSDYVLHHKAPGQNSFKALPGKDCTFTQEGTHTFRAVRDNKTSNEVTVSVRPSVLTLQVSKDQISANDSETSTLTVLQDGTRQTSGYQIKVKTPNTTAFENYNKTTFKTANAGRYVFVVEKGHLRSSEVSIVAKSVSLVLSANSNNPIANGSDKITFTLREDDRTVSDYVLHHKAPGQNTFKVLQTTDYTCTEDGTHTFKAVRGRNTSNEVTVSVRASKLTLKASKERITADNSDHTIFTILQDDVRLTDGYQLKVKAPNASNFVLHNEVTFKTDNAGRYTFIVVKGRLRSSEVHVEAVAKPAPPTPKPTPPSTEPTPPTPQPTPPAPQPTPGGDSDFQRKQTDNDCRRQGLCHLLDPSRRARCHFRLYHI